MRLYICMIFQAKKSLNSIDKIKRKIILEITIMTRSSRKGKGSGGEREGKGVREGKGERNCLD